MRRENREAAQVGSRYQEPRRQLLQAEHVVGDTKSSSKNKAANPKCRQPVVKLDCSSSCSQDFLAQATASWLLVPQSAHNAVWRLRVLTPFISKCQRCSSGR